MRVGLVGGDEGEVAEHGRDRALHVDVVDESDESDESNE